VKRDIPSTGGDKSPPTDGCVWGVSVIKLNVGKIVHAFEAPNWMVFFIYCPSEYAGTEDQYKQAIRHTM
jgi:hypothetical protein